MVYAFYLNDSDKIMKYLEKTNKTPLNKKLQYTDSLLEIWAENNILESFKTIAEKGADIRKIFLAIVH